MCTLARMRALVATFAALILMMPPAAQAQVRSGGHQRPSPPPRMPALPPTVPPPIVYPFPSLMPPPPGGLNPRFGENPPFRTRQQLFFPGSPGYAPLFFGDQESTDLSVRRSQAAVPDRGLLRLSVNPPGAQVFVDSYYVGTVEDINAQRVVELEAGPHRIEFRAPQYQTLTVDVRILPYETVTYRGALEPVRPQVQPGPAAAASTVMYLIPKCYLGNIPPREGRLPSGCDIKQVQVLNPPATASRR